MWRRALAAGRHGAGTARGGRPVLGPAHPPAAGGQVDGQQLLLAAEPQPGREPADLAERRHPEHGRPGEHAEQGRAGPPGRPGDGGVAQLRGQRVLPQVGLDQDPGGDRGQAGVGVEQVGGPGEGARLPAAVVAEGHVPAPDPLHGQVAAQRPQVGPAPRIRVTSGKAAATASAVPSLEALSTTATGARSSSVVMCRSVGGSSSRRLWVMTTTVVRFIHCELHVGALRSGGCLRPGSVASGGKRGEGPGERDQSAAGDAGERFAYRCTRRLAARTIWVAV